jgi:hypothetical protein
MNMTDQITPWGNLSYQQTGMDTFTDEFGNVVNTPRYTQTMSLSPEAQRIVDQTMGAQGDLINLVRQKTADIGNAPELVSNYMTDPNFGQERYSNLLMERMAPQMQQDEAKLRSQLINQGLRVGSAGYNSEMDRLSRNVNDARISAQLAGTSVARDAAAFQNQARGQTFSELGSLMGISQPQIPPFQQTPQTGVAGVDYAGLVNDKYQADVSKHNAMMGGLFGLLGAGLTAFSDERLKEDITPMGETFGGTPVYDYRYKWEPEGTHHVGVMAQEVEKTNPEAVKTHPSGYKMVDYSKVV